jgi:ketosteroid isomerase-like protein
LIDFKFMCRPATHCCVIGALGLLLLLGFAQNARADECSATGAVQTMNSIIDADNARDLKVLTYYTPDVVWVPPHGHEIVGLAMIKTRYEDMYGAYRPRLMMRVTAVIAGGGTAIIRGVTRGKLIGNPTRQVNDRFAATLRCDRGRGWQVSRLEWSAAQE